MFKKTADYLRTSFEEIQKVTWPTWKEARNSTILVVSFSLGMSVLLFVLDLVFSKGFETLLQNSDKISF